MSKYAALVVLCGTALLVGCGSSTYSTNDSSREQAINTLVANAGQFAVPADTGLTAKGDAGTTTVTQGGTVFECTEQKVSASANVSDIVVFNPNADVLWPGSMIQGNSIVDGTLNPVPSARAPGTVVLTIASSSAQKSSLAEDMKTPNLSSTYDAINKILSGYAAANGATPAKFSYESATVGSTQEFDFDLGAKVSWANVNINPTFSINNTSQKSRVMVKLRQEYYTLAFQPPTSASKFFDTTVAAKDLAPYTGPGNPLTYISTVTYGRLFVFLFESDSSALALKAAVDATFQIGIVNPNVHLDTAYQNTMKNSSVKVFALGGNASDAANAAITTGDLTGLNKFIVDGASFDARNPGVPISYTVRYVTDSTQVRVNITTDYTVQQCTAVDATQDIDVHTISVHANNSCTDGFWSTTGAYYWHWSVDVINPDQTVASTTILSQTNHNTAAQVSNGQTIQVAYSVPLHAVPRVKGTCVRVYGDIWANRANDYKVGDFSDLHCYDGNAWAPIGSKTTTLNPSQCGANAAELTYAFNPL